MKTSCGNQPAHSRAASLWLVNSDCCWLVIGCWVICICHQNWVALWLELSYSIFIIHNIMRSVCYAFKYVSELTRCIFLPINVINCIKSVYFACPHLLTRSRFRLSVGLWSEVGGRSFTVAGAKLWNSLPSDVFRNRL